ncbi:MAG: sensor histidine kinase [Parvibaculaceae bacterium]
MRIRDRLKHDSGSAASARQSFSLERICDTLPIGLAFLSPDCRYVWINERLTEICGIPVADHLGRSVRETLPRLAEQVEAIVQSVIASGEPIAGIEVSGERPDEHGAQRYWLTSWQPMKGDDGSIIGVSVAAEEISQRKRAEAALEFAKLSRQSTLGAMTASIAHEITQPLGAIVTNAGAGLRWLGGSDANLDEARAALERIIDNGHRASRLISSIRGMFGKDQPERLKVDLNEVIGETLALVHGELVKRDVSLQTKLFDGPLEVVADRTQLQQVVLNLTMNAIEAMAGTTGRPRRVVVSSERRGANEASVTVSDSGAGIAPENVDRIFEPFFTTKSSGMGMGLAICRSIMQAHGGNLWASPQASGGTIFHMLIPID